MWPRLDSQLWGALLLLEAQTSWWSSQPQEHVLHPPTARSTEQLGAPSQRSAWCASKAGLVTGSCYLPVLGNPTITRDGIWFTNPQSCVLPNTRGMAESALVGSSVRSQCTFTSTSARGHRHQRHELYRLSWMNINILHHIFFRNPIPQMPFVLYIFS